MGKKSTDNSSFASGERQQNNQPATLRDIMSTNVVTVKPEMSVVAAAHKMTMERITCMVVTKDGSVVGIITNNDFMRKIVLENKQYSDLTVGQIMTTPVISLSDDVTIAKAIQLIDEKRIKHLPVVSNGKLAGIVTQTDFYRASQSELEKKFANLQDQSQAQLQYANRRLEAEVQKTSKDEHETVVADLAKNHFLANMSHEIRTPLNAIIGLSEVLAEENLTEEQQSHLAIIRESAQNMMVLINDILDFSKIEAGKFNLDISECSLEHLLAVVESLMRPPAMQKGLDFGIFQRTDLPALIKTDPLRLRQCLTNLIYNAIDFTEKGHIFINIFFENTDGKDFIRFDVEDTGIGIAKEDQQKIFQEFTQVAIVHNRKSAATGLGLTITKRLTGLLGGEIHVQSEPGKGSKFSIIIPVGVDTKAQPVFNKYDQIKKIKKEKP
ncbi:MAG: CBS domain-containing protein, partial [Phycisphaerae bacterium]